MDSGKSFQATTVCCFDASHENEEEHRRVLNLWLSGGKTPRWIPRTFKPEEPLPPPKSTFSLSLQELAAWCIRDHDISTDLLPNRLRELVSGVFFKIPLYLYLSRHKAHTTGIGWFMTDESSSSPLYYSVCFSYPQCYEPSEGGDDWIVLETPQEYFRGVDGENIKDEIYQYYRDRVRFVRKWNNSLNPALGPSRSKPQS